MDRSPPTRRSAPDSAAPAAPPIRESPRSPDLSASQSNRLSLGVGRGKGRGVPLGSLAQPPPNAVQVPISAASDEPQTLATDKSATELAAIRETLRHQAREIAALKDELADLRKWRHTAETTIANLQQQSRSGSTSAAATPSEMAPQLTEWLLEHDLQHLAPQLHENGVRSVEQLQRGYASEEPTDIEFLIDDFGGVLSKFDIRCEKKKDVLHFFSSS